VSLRRFPGERAAQLQMGAQWPPARPARVRPMRRAGRSYLLVWRALWHSWQESLLFWAVRCAAIETEDSQPHQAVVGSATGSHLAESSLARLTAERHGRYNAVSNAGVFVMMKFGGADRDNYDDTKRAVHGRHRTSTCCSPRRFAVCLGGEGGEEPRSGGGVGLVRRVRRRGSVRRS